MFKPFEIGYMTGRDRFNSYHAKAIEDLESIKQCYATSLMKLNKEFLERLQLILNNVSEGNKTDPLPKRLDLLSVLNHLDFKQIPKEPKYLYNLIGILSTHESSLAKHLLVSFLEKLKQSRL